MHHCKKLPNSLLHHSEGCCIIYMFAEGHWKVWLPLKGTESMVWVILLWVNGNVRWGESTVGPPLCSVRLVRVPPWYQLRQFGSLGNAQSAPEPFLSTQDETVNQAAGDDIAPQGMDQFNELRFGLRAFYSQKLGFSLEVPQQPRYFPVMALLFVRLPGSAQTLVFWVRSNFCFLVSWGPQSGQVHAV